MLLICATDRVQVVEVEALQDHHDIGQYEIEEIEGHFKVESRKSEIKKCYFNFF